jgi:hypothetical protein
MMGILVQPQEGTYRNIPDGKRTRSEQPKIIGMSTVEAEHPTRSKQKSEAKDNQKDGIYGDKGFEFHIVLQVHWVSGKKHPWVGQ